jgi:hypothetical protein
MRKSVKRTIALKRGGTQNMFMSVSLKLQQVIVSRKEILLLAIDYFQEYAINLVIT